MVERLVSLQLPQSATAKADTEILLLEGKITINVVESKVWIFGDMGRFGRDESSVL